MLAFDSIGQDGLAEAPASGPISASASQSISVAQSATAQVIVQALAVQSLGIAQSASDQVIVSTAPVQSLSVQQVASDQEFVSLSASQTLSIQHFISPRIELIRYPGGGLGSGHFSDGEWHRIKSRRAQRLEDQKRSAERALAAKRKKELERKRKREAELAARLAEIDQSGRLASQQLLMRQAAQMQNVIQALGVQQAHSQMMALRAQSEQDQEEEDMAALLAALD